MLLLDLCILLLCLPHLFSISNLLMKEKMSDGLVCDIINMAIEVGFRHKTKFRFLCIILSLYLDYLSGMCAYI